MDFTMNMMDNARGIPASQAAAVAAMGNVAVYQAQQAHQPGHGISMQQNQQQHQQQQSHQAALAAAAAAAAAAVGQHHHRNSLQDDSTTSLATEAAKLQELKDDSEETFTPPPRVSSVSSLSHQDARAEKGTDTTDFEPVIKIEIRGGIPGLNLGNEKDKNNVVQLHFNSPSEVLHYFSQRSVPQLDAFNLLTNPDLVRNINPDLVRNHFLYVPSSQEGVRVPSNGFTASNAQTTQVQGGPVIVTGPNGAPKAIKQERRRGEVPPGTIIHRNIQLEPQPNQFVCWICGLDLQKSLPFEEHMVDQHSVEKPYKCDDCGVTFKRKAHLDRHRRIHLPTRPYQCGVCGKGFTRNEHVRRHAFTHSGEKPYPCPTCGKTFSRREHLSKHLVSHTKAGLHSPSQLGHPNTPGEYDEYLYSPAESPNLQQPQQQHSNPPHLQHQQQMLFPSPGEAAATGHSSGLLHFPQFASQSPPSANVGLNMIKQRSNGQPGLTTTLLLQTTDSNGRLVTLNQGTAGGGPPGVSSSTSSHMYSSSSGSTSNTSQTSHAIRGTTNANGEPVARPYQCGVCGKAFIRNEHLRRHVLTHSGEKPHSCSLCGKAFSRREHLTKHLRSHAAKGITTPGALQPQGVPVTASPSGQTSMVVSVPSSGAGASAMAPPASSSVNTQPVPAHSHSQSSVVHSIASSHGSGAVAHLPAGTHYLPMFNLLAEVV